MSNKKPDRQRVSRPSNDYRKGSKVEDITMLNVLNYEKNY